jgi:hypothetical protein
MAKKSRKRKKSTALVLAEPSAIPSIKPTALARHQQRAAELQQYADLQSRESAVRTAHKTVSAERRALGGKIRRRKATSAAKIALLGVGIGFIGFLLGKR